MHDGVCRARFPQSGKSPRRLSLVLIPVLGLVILGPRSAAAHAWFTYGLGARAVAMGNAYVAIADDATAAYNNPAGITALTRPSVMLGFSDIAYDLRIDGHRAGLPDVPSLVFGTTFPLPLEKLLGIRAAFGFDLQMSGDVLLQQTVPFPTVPQFVLLQNSAKLLHLLPALAIEPVPGVSVGFGVMLFDNTIGALSLGLGARGDATFEIDQELKTIMSPLVGVRADLGQLAPELAGWRLGLAFRDAFSIPYRIPVNAFLGGLPLVVDFSATALYTPQQLEAGVAFTPRDGWTVAAEVLWNRWSRFPDPSLAINLDLAIPVLPITFTDSAVHDPRFHDTVSARVGVEGPVVAWPGAELLARLGYQYEPTPAPQQTGDTNFLDSNRHVVSTGVGVALREVFGSRLPAPLHVDAYAQVQILEDRLHHKSSDVPADNPGFPTVRGGGDLYQFGLAVSSELELLDR